MAKLEAAAVAELLIELGQRIEISGDSPFKARAYHRAAESLLALTVPLDEVIAAGRLRDLPGVGAAIADKIVAFHESGTHPTEGFRLTDGFQRRARIGAAAFWPLFLVTGRPPQPEEEPLGSRIYTKVTLSFEQSANPDSRITLSETRDDLGTRRAQLDWRLNDLDRRTFATALKVTELHWGCHHMGTTRMHVEPRHGVVDPQGRVHGIANLYIAGSSVFPNVGFKTRR